jgi:O-antigen/teichoic acid export membrane protein
VRNNVKIPDRFVTVGVLAFGRLLQSVLQIVTVRLLTTVLSPLEVGRFYALASVQGWVSLMLGAAPWLYLNRNYLEWRRNDLDGSAFGVFLGYTVFLGGLTALIAWALLYFSVVSTTILWLVAGSILGLWMVGASVMSQTALLVNLLGHSKTFVILRSGGMITGLGLATWLTTSQANLAESWIFGLGVGNLGFACIAIVILLRLSNLKFPKSLTKREDVIFLVSNNRTSGASFMWPVMIMTGLYWVQSQGYRIPIAMYLGESELGLFSVAYSMGANVVIAAEAVIVSQWLVPMYYRKIVGMNANETDEVWRDCVAVIFPVIMVVGVFSVFAGPFMLRLLAHDNFQAAVYLSIWGGLAESIRVIAGLFYIGGIGRQNTRNMILPHIPGAMTVVVAAATIGYYNSLHWLGLVIALSYFVLALSLWVYVDRKMIVELSIRDFRLPVVSIFLMTLMFVLAWVNHWYQDEIWSALGLMVLGGISLLGIFPSVRNLQLEKRLE